MARKKDSDKKIITSSDSLSSEYARIKRQNEESGKITQRSQDSYQAPTTNQLNKIITAPGISNVGRKGLKPISAQSAGNQTVRMAPQINSPFFDSTNFNLPLDRISRNAWCRFYYKVDGVVASALELHTDYPLTNYTNDCKDHKIKEFYDQMAFDELDIMTLLHDIGLEYWKIGDVFPIGQFDNSRGVWDHFLLLNPDYVDVSRSYLSAQPTISLIPDAVLKDIVNGGSRGQYSDQYNQLPQEIIEAVRGGSNIPLPDANVSQISHKASRYETYGTPLLNRCFKTLLYKDKIRTAQQAIVERHITPIRVWKVGGDGENPPTQDELEDFRNLLAQAELDYNHTIVFHNQIDFMATNNTQTIFQLTPEYEFVRYELNAGLMVSETFITGDGPNFATANVSLEVLEKRYRTYQSMLSRWIERSVYAPVAEAQEFYEPISSEVAHGYRIKDRPKKLIYPRVSWRGRELIEYKDDAPNIYIQLQESNNISKRTLLDKLGFNYETEMSRIAQEAQDHAAFQETGSYESPGGGDSGGFSSDLEAPSNMTLPSGAGEFTEESAPNGTSEAPGPENMGIAPPEGK
jgi:hypothetical protein